MKNNKNLAWALVGLLILIVLGGYFYSADPLGWQGGSNVEKKESAESKPEGTDTGKSGTASSDATAVSKADESKSAGADGESSSNGEVPDDATAQLSIPTFDLVRVEPDGSTLIAGQAAPGTAVEVVANGKVIATVTAGTSGDFAAVVDDRLAPGDHEIFLRSTGADDSSAQSEEVATISVPENDPSELLVMVTKPGEASRILTKPDALESQVGQEASTATEIAASGETEEKQVAAVKAEEATTTGSAASAKSNDTESMAAETGESEPEKVMAEAKDAVTEQSSGSTSGDMDTAETEIARSGEGAAKSEAVVAAGPKLRIDAVEIENGRMFIAGSATPGGEVRVYADGQAIGTSNVSKSGRFLVEAQNDVSVGDHTISADLVMRAGGAPVMRVTVPFTRPQGEMVSAIAAPSTDSSAQSGSAANETAAEQTEENSSRMAAADTLDTVTGQPSASDAASSASNTQTEVASADTQSDDAKTVVQPALEPHGSSVIIRRGDTLWQISRRVYGRGVRYTTIYLANEPLINNPDLIEPGQVFEVPEKHLENAEELHRQRMRGR